MLYLYSCALALVQNIVAHELVQSLPPWGKFLLEKLGRYVQGYNSIFHKTNTKIFSSETCFRQIRGDPTEYFFLIIFLSFALFVCNEERYNKFLCTISKYK